jgi:hypothetical protein
LAATASNTSGNGDVLIISWADCFPDDPDKARELATSTGVPGIQVYPENIFSRASDSQVSNAVDASQKSDETRAELETQTSSRGAVEAEIEGPTLFKTLPPTGVSDSNAATDITDSWVPRTVDSAKIHDVNSSDSADEEVWVKVDVGTDNLATSTDM